MQPRAYRYKAFLSYSHADRRAAAWLHRRLEHYRFPGSVRQVRPDLPDRLYPIFRDREELSAGHDLADTIQTALAESERLVVLCSPAAARSHWVNEEVRTFQRAERAADIVCVIIDGDPGGSDEPGDLFPPSLSGPNGAGEPLAADLRETGDGRRLGLLKLIAGLAGLRVDDLVQRDLRRARRRVTTVTVSAAAIVLSLVSLTLIAIGASKSAEQRRHVAEGQIEFMLTDLRDRLETVGRLDVLQPVGERAASYYESIPLSDHDDDSLGRRARVFHYLGEIQDALGNIPEAARHFSQAYDATARLLARDPDNADRLFEHSQSAFWVGQSAWRHDDAQATRTAFEEYRDLVLRWQPIAQDRQLALVERSSAEANMGVFFESVGQYTEARAAFQASIDVLEGAAADYPDDAEFAGLLANSHSWLEVVATAQRDYGAAEHHAREQVQLAEALIARDPAQTWEAVELMAVARQRLSRALYHQKRTEEALAQIAQSQALFQQMVEHDRDNPSWWRMKSGTDALHLALLCQAGPAPQTDAARDAVRTSIPLANFAESHTPQMILDKFDLNPPIDLGACHDG